jgi:PAS domain-containing protein
MPDSSADRALRGLAAPTLATLALVLVVASGTFAAFGLGAGVIVLVLLAIYLHRAVLLPVRRVAQAARRSEEQLRLSGDRLQGILDHASALISVKDADGRYLLVGRRW